MDKDIIEKKIESLDDYYGLEFDDEESSLLDQLTLGDNWDDPDRLGVAMDRQPFFYSRWAYLYKMLVRKMKQLETRVGVYTSKAKEQIYQDLYDKNIEGGMTPNNAKPTSSQVDNVFEGMYNELDDDGDYMVEEYGHLMEQKSKLEDQIDKVKIVVEAFAQRKDMLISMSSLVRSMMDDNLVVKKDRPKMKFKRKRE